MMKPLRESSRPALRLCAGKIAEEATRWHLFCIYYKQVLLIFVKKYFLAFL